MQKTYKITISGQVQGVGFRPFVYNLANKFSLDGTVSNNQEGVIIYISGAPKNIKDFYKKLTLFPPPVSKIQHSSITKINFVDYKKFRILPSNKNGQLNLPLTPDFAICNDCKKELKDKKNRRYNYPFTTCVNCGPRWAITKTFPFERNNTSTNEFVMCNDCLKEYKNPYNRRFHSQTNTCPACGISLKLIDSKENEIEIINNNIYNKVAKLLLEGNIVAIKNASGYLLCCNAENTEIIQKLRTKKFRQKKPFAVLFPSLEFLKKEFTLSKKELKSLTSTESPITVIPLKNYHGKIAINSVAPKLNQLGVMLPYTSILELLASKLSFPIVATSGNIHGSPIINTNNEAIEKLKDVADYFLQHNLKITHPQDDSVIKISAKFNQKVLFRRSRGFAPNYFGITIKSSENILAMGADLKSSIAFFPNEYLYLSQYIGNLENYDVYNRFTATVNSFIKIFEQQPQVILTDKHPNYHSAQFGKELAKKTNSKLVEIQHHRAHFSAILGEHNLFNQKVLGVIFDGTGFGEDSQIWGGEFFKYEKNTIKRIEHLEYFDWILGDKMSKEPRISLLCLASSEMNKLLAQKFTPNEICSYHYLKSNNKLKTSSVGRLFDAVASLLNITDFNSYEGEAAILLENFIKNYELKSCKSYLIDFDNGFSAKEIIKNIYLDLKKGASKQSCAANFLFTLATSILYYAKTNNYQHVAFSGGVFQNTTLVDMLIELASKKIKLYFHKNLTPNDENISFGQTLHYLNINN